MTTNAPTSGAGTKTKHKRRMFPLRPSFIHHEQSHLRTNTSKIIERTYPHTNCSTPWERNPKVIPVYLLTAQRSIIRQHTFSSYTPSTFSSYTPSIQRRRCLWTSTSTTGTRFTPHANLMLIRCKPGPRGGGRGPQTTSSLDAWCVRGGCAWCVRGECVLSDHTSLGSEKIHRNNFRVSLPRCRAVRVRVCSFDDLGGVRSKVRLFVVNEAGSEREHPTFMLCLRA